MAFSFDITARCPSTRARTGRFVTPHGVVETPRFMPVGTAATVKGLSTPQLAETGAQMVLANTFHLHLQPGEDVVAEAGGLHRFMAWDGPLLTDSGGFQVFSLGAINRINDDGVVFRSPRDGSRIELTPERAMAIQMALGADVAMAFDQCPPYPATESEVAAACRRTHHWLERCAACHTKADQALFGIVQGGCFPHLRDESARVVAAMDLPGIAVGGVSVGEADFTKAMMKKLGDVAFWKIAMRPGRPMAVGRIGQAVLFGLPGNPVAVMVTFLAFVRPALLQLMGCTDAPPPLLKARSLDALRKKPGRTEYQRGMVTRSAQGQLEVRTTGNQGSGVLSSMVQGNGLIVLHHAQGNVALGDEVDVLMFEGAL